MIGQSGCSSKSIFASFSDHCIVAVRSVDGGFRSSGGRGWHTEDSLISHYSTWQPMHAALMRSRHNTPGAPSILLYIASHHASLSIPDHHLHIFLLIVSNLHLAFACNHHNFWGPSALNPFFEQNNGDLHHVEQDRVLAGCCRPSVTRSLAGQELQCRETSTR